MIGVIGQPPCNSHAENVNRPCQQCRAVKLQAVDGLLDHEEKNKLPCAEEADQEALKSKVLAAFRTRADLTIFAATQERTGRQAVTGSSRIGQLLVRVDQVRRRSIRSSEVL